MSSSYSCFLTCMQVSQVRWFGTPISLRIFHSLLWSTQSKALVQPMKQKQMFFWNSLVFSMIQWMLAIWSLVPLPFLKPAWTSGISRFTYCWNLAWRILSITLLACWRSCILSTKTRPGTDCGSDHELLIAKFRLKLKKVGKTTRPFRYDLSQIPCDYTVEMRNRLRD